EAAKEAAAFGALAEDEREALLAFLRGLVLYSVDQLPCDINGDGQIEPHFKVAGQDTGIERLNPEWLFLTPGRIEGRIKNITGRWITSFALMNVDEAYGCSLDGLRDSNHDGFPDIRVPAK